MFKNNSSIIAGVLAHMKLGALIAIVDSTSSLHALHCSELAVRKEDPVTLKDVFRR